MFDLEITWWIESSRQLISDSNRGGYSSTTIEGDGFADCTVVKLAEF
jgi:hypothetical protein